jgi:maltose O-acetyltransferase
MNLLRKLVRKLRKKREETQLALYQDLDIGLGTSWSITNLDGIVPQLISIGRDCIIAPTAMILTHDASFFIHTGRYKVAPVKIADRVFVGYGAIIMPGVSIGENAIIGAGAVVTHDVPGNTIVVGVPARALCSTDELMGRERDDLFEPPYRFGQQITQNDILRFQQQLLRKMSREHPDGEPSE